MPKKKKETKKKEDVIEVTEEVKKEEVPKKKKEVNIFEEYNNKFNKKLEIEKYLIDASKEIAEKINGTLKKRGYDTYVPPKKKNGVVLEKIILLDVSEKRFIGINHAGTGSRLSSVRIKFDSTLDSICDEIIKIYEKMIEKKNKRYY